MPPLDTLAAALSDRYTIERELGSGGMATVYLALDEKHDRQVALKVLRPELGAVLGAERFLAEIKITARLDHPHILTLIDSGAADGLLYYVLPFARGESLREKLNREKQLGLEEAVMITKQIASALDYAHKQGVVHRDIKPENILIQEGEAMLADFGIALAVKEAGGNRLTETGLSLGTPQYMSPEQATGDRTIDARSDVYSLAAVLYEMLAGEPPVTGPSAQAMIAKLMMERPTHLRVVRESVPPAIDAAVAKALDKTPADRFASAGDFARALELKSAASPEAPIGKRRSLVLAVGAAAFAAVAVVVALAVSGKFSAKRGVYTLKDRTQLTFSGAVQLSAITPDGKQLAFVSRECQKTDCSYSVNLQDIGGTSTRRILDGASTAYALVWSPDRRNLLFQGTIKKRFGMHLISALGGPPRLLTASAATFWAGGDSLLVAGGYGALDSTHYVRVTGIDGTVHDSILVAGMGNGVDGLSVSPSGKWIIALIIQKGRGFWQVFDRSGKVYDHLLNSCTCPGQVTDGALWLTRAGRGFESIIRLSLDPKSGKLGAQQDTLYSGRFNNFTVIADGESLVIDDGTTDYSIWAEDAADAFKGRFPDNKRVIKTSNLTRAMLSPDGARLIVRRMLATTGGQSEQRLTLMPFAGGTESPFPGQGSPRYYGWVDSTSVLTATLTPRGMHVALLDVTTGSPKRSVDLPDSIYWAIEPLPDGWAYIPASGDKIVVQRGTGTSEIALPAWFGGVRGLAVSPDGKQLAMSGWNRITTDTLGVAVVSLAGGAPVMWTTTFAEWGEIDYLNDGSPMLMVYPTNETREIWKLRGPGQKTFVGSVPRPIAGLDVSRDLKRAVVLVTDYHGDAWMSKVARQ